MDVLIGCIILTVKNMDIKEMRLALGKTQKEFADRYSIPYRTIQNWENGVRKPPEYIVKLLNERIKNMINKKLSEFPTYDENKIQLPRLRDYICGLDWLRDVQKAIDEPVVFALDQALMCQQTYLGINDEFIVSVYGSDELKRFNGVAVVGNYISENQTETNFELRYTNFNRTVIDAIENEDILDMQGITEALSDYYFSHNESFSGLYIPQEYQEVFQQLCDDAIDYYTY